MRSRLIACVGVLGVLTVAHGAMAWTADPPMRLEARAAGSPPPWAMRAAARLPLRKRIGQVLIGGFSGSRLSRAVQRDLVAGRLSGVILFADNVASAPQVRRLTRSIRRASGASGLVSVDQEGGLVRRIPFAAPGPGQPSQGSLRRVRRIARKAARNLRGLGINVNLAPVADVSTTRRSALAARAFRGSVRVVGRKTAGAVASYRRGRVAATVKHFPGLGSAPANTDDAPVVIRRKRSRLRRIDLAPFRAAIRAQVPLVMAAHATYTALDSKHIASQSRPILNRLLRRDMGFEGAVITDALEAVAVTRRSTVAEAAERSLKAGADLLLLAEPASRGPAYRRLLARARVSPSVRKRLTQATARVLVLKRSLGLRLPAGRLGGSRAPAPRDIAIPDQGG